MGITESTVDTGQTRPLSEPAHLSTRTIPGPLLSAPNSQVTSSGEPSWAGYPAPSPRVPLTARNQRSHRSLRTWPLSSPAPPSQVLAQTTRFGDRGRKKEHTDKKHPKGEAEVSFYKSLSVIIPLKTGGGNNKIVVRGNF